MKEKEENSKKGERDKNLKGLLKDRNLDRFVYTSTEGLIFHKKGEKDSKDNDNNGKEKDVKKSKKISKPPR